MNDHTALPPGVIYLPNGSGRSYLLGRMRSVFKADGEETCLRSLSGLNVQWSGSHFAQPDDQPDAQQRRSVRRMIQCASISVPARVR